MSLIEARARFAAARTDFLAVSGITLREARKGIVAASEVLTKLVENTADLNEIDRYTQQLQALTAELAKVVNEELLNSEARYTPITEQFKAAADALKETKRRADQLAAQLSIAGDVLGSFTKLLGAFA
jgi:seryl-tRNA synthetase